MTDEALAEFYNSLKSLATKYDVNIVFPMSVQDAYLPMDTLVVLSNEQNSESTDKIVLEVKKARK